MFHLSAAQGPRWARTCDEFTQRIQELGPSPVRRALEAERSKEPSPEADRSPSP